MGLDCSRSNNGQMHLDQVTPAEEQALKGQRKLSGVQKAVYSSVQVNRLISNTWSELVRALTAGVMSGAPTLSNYIKNPGLYIRTT